LSDENRSDEGVLETARAGDARPLLLLADKAILVMCDVAELASL
jgi:hypothetical protein